MKLSQVAIQLYTLRNHLKSREAIDETLRKVAAIGYPAVQISGMPNPWPVTEGEFVALAARHGLTICATHEPALDIVNEPLKVVERLKKLGCKHTAYPHPRDVDFSSVESVTAWIASLGRAGAVLAAHGLTLSYHNHQVEFIKVGGKIILERIFDETDPAHLQGEPDTYWVQVGGGDPVRWCERLAGRLPLLHLKDYEVRPDKTVGFCEIGRGVLDFPRIVAAADRAGCEWFIVEQDQCPGDEFDSIRQSFDYIQAHLVSA